MLTQIDALLEILETEAACYRELQTVLVDEAASMTLSTRDGFDQVQKGKEGVVANLRQLEKKRLRIVALMAGAHSAQDRPMTVTQLARTVDSPAKEKLLVAAKRLRAIIAEVQRQNRFNQQLMNQYLDLIKGSLKLLSGLIDESPVYQRPGVPCGGGAFQTRGGRIIRGTV